MHNCNCLVMIKIYCVIVFLLFKKVSINLQSFKLFLWCSPAALIPSSYLLLGPSYPVAHKEIKNQLGPLGVNKTLDGSTDPKWKNNHVIQFYFLSCQLKWNLPYLGSVLPPTSLLSPITFDWYKSVGLMAGKALVYVCN